MSGLKDCEKPYVPTGRLAAILEPHIAMLGVNIVSFRTGVAQRALWRIRSGESKLTAMPVADRIITGLELDAWHVPPPEGLADIYEAV